MKKWASKKKVSKRKVISASKRGDRLSVHFIPFGKLSPSALYEILALRERVFTFEQKCTEPDMDGQDREAIHGCLWKKGKLVGCIRFLPPATKGKSLYFGRLVISPEFRGQGYAARALESLIDYAERNFPGQTIACSAQAHLAKFYSGYGFRAYGATYLEAGIPHVKMKRVSPTS